MRKYLKEDTVGRTVFFCATILVTVLTLSTGTLGIVNKVVTLRQDLENLQKEFINEQKEHLKADVDALVQRIDFRQELLHAELERDLEKRVEEARMLAANIHQATAGKLSREEIIGLIREAIRPIRFHNAQGYYFIFDYSGRAILYPVAPDLEGTSLLTSTVADTPEIISKLIKIAREQDRGLAAYDWFKPDADIAARFPKISYVCNYAPLELVIGTGEYLDNLEEVAQQSIVADLHSNWRSVAMDYYFAYQLHALDGGEGFATMLINHNRPDLEGQKISDDALDKEGFAYRKAFMEGIRDTGEAHVVYWYKKPDGSGYGRKLSYFKLYPRWNWILARGIYFDRLDEEIVAQKALLKQRVIREILQLGGIFLLGVGLSLVIAYWFSRQLQVIFDDYNHTRRQNMMELENLNMVLENQNRTDSLTGIANRTHFNERLEQEVAQVGRYGGELSLLLFDIDHFKEINDIHGHLQGDSVLQRMARLIQANIRRIDLFARWGGEEFVILAPGIDADHALQLANKLRVIIEHHDFPHGEKVTCSFGVGRYGAGEEGKDFIHRVDTALYLAKEQGRNCCVTASVQRVG